MTYVYFDSSALVKLVIEEDSSELVSTLWDGADAVISSRLADPEVRAAIAAARRARRLNPRAEANAQEQWGGYWAALRVVELTAAVAKHAGELARRHSLRGADAVHLASALTVGPDYALFAVWDARLLAGARNAGFTTTTS